MFDEVDLRSGEHGPFLFVAELGEDGAFFDSLSVFKGDGGDGFGDVGGDVDGLERADRSQGLNFIGEGAHFNGSGLDLGDGGSGFFFFGLAIAGGEEADEGREGGPGRSEFHLDGG